MAVHSNSEDSRILRNFYPLVTFPSEAFKDLCSTINVEYIQDAAIFKKGDTNTDLVYLLEGSVTLQAEGLVIETITSDSDSAKFALAHQIPRKIDAIANGAARIVRLDAHTVNNPPPAVYREDLGYTVDEESEDPDDWMTALLRLPLFQSLPPANLQKILMNLKTANYSEGSAIITAKSAVNNFFVLTKGQCLLTRKTPEGSNEIKLVVGDSFGEEYLLTDMPAQETITALSDVNLIQLEKQHFLAQFIRPTVHFIEHEAMPGAIKNNAVLLDVRSELNYENYNLANSANIPLMSLRMRISEIPKDKQIIVTCSNGLASTAAAFLLSKHNINAQVLKDGIGWADIPEEMEEKTDSKENSTYQPEISSLEQSIGVGVQAAVTGATPSIETLLSENAKLVQHNHELEESNKKLQAEKEQAENQCQVLTQQLERLKEILNRLTKAK